MNAINETSNATGFCECGKPKQPNAEMCGTCARFPASADDVSQIVPCLEPNLCIIEDCGRPIHPERLAMKPGLLLTCSHACAKLHKRHINQKAQRKYMAGKRAAIKLTRQAETTQ